MAWRLDQHVIKGEIQNRIPGKVTGLIWLKGLNQPVELKLKGNCYRDLAGAKLVFENLTMAPIDKDLIDLNLLNKKEKNWLNNYHRKVFNNLEKTMNKIEKLELKKACSAI